MYEERKKKRKEEIKKFNEKDGILFGLSYFYP